MNYTIYDPTTGQILSVVQTADTDLANLNLQDQTWIEGFYNGNDYYIDNGLPIQMPAKPQDGSAYIFDWSTKAWIINIDQTANNARNQRNNLLSIVDRVNPVWYASLSQEQQQALAAYRQQLLDVPQQSGFPSTVEWPAKPVWL